MRVRVLKKILYIFYRNTLNYKVIIIINMVITDHRFRVTNRMSKQLGMRKFALSLNTCV